MAQVKNGIVEYKVTSYSKPNFVNSMYAKIPVLTKNDAEIKKLVYTLKFNENESIFQADAFMGIDSKKYAKTLRNAGCNETYYNAKANSGHLMFVDDSEFGPTIVEYPNNPAWTLTTETKLIANYKCYKATCEKKDFATPGKNNILALVAWYCPELPIALGPIGFYGLPGLILEIEIPKRSAVFSASAIKLNVTEKIVINKPNKGKLISETQYRKLVENEIEEMYK